MVLPTVTGAIGASTGIASVVPPGPLWRRAVDAGRVPRENLNMVKTSPVDVWTQERTVQQRRLLGRARRLGAVVAALQEQARMHRTCGPVPRPLQLALGDFQRELADVEAELRAVGDELADLGEELERLES